MSWQTRLAREIERLVVGRPPAITLVVQGPHNSWSATKYFDLLAERRRVAVQFLGVRGYDLFEEVASAGLYPDLALQFRLRGYSDDFVRSDGLPQPSRDDYQEEATMLPAGKENYPEFWEQGLQFARITYDRIVGTPEEPRTMDELKALIGDEVEALQEATYASLTRQYEEAQKVGQQIAYKPEGINTMLDAATKGLVELFRSSIRP